jgi:4-amino-4-deoxy-L-arabinose transferase-like glycosyltransferase
VWLPLALIVFVGAALRLYRIGELPPGLYRDEGFYGLDALRVLNGDLSIYFAANNGREPLFIYLLAGAVAMFGRTVLALRLTSALVGIASIVAIYFAGRNLFSPRIGVLSAAILAVTFWHIAISRVAFRAITLPLVLCLMMAFIFAGLRTNQLRPRLIYSALAGAAFGLTFYTYTSGQFVLPLVILYALSLWIGLRRDLFVRRSEETRYRRRMSALVFTLAALIVLAPLLVWLTQHADVYFNRAGQVSILNPDINRGNLIGALLDNILKAANMFVWQGDRIWRHNLSLRPVFDAFIAVAFVIGAGVCAWRWLRSWQSRFGSDILGVEANIAPQFVLLWLIVFLAPTILAEDTPHFLRAIGALPAACIIAAVGLESALAWMSRRGLFGGLVIFLRRRISPPAFIAAILLVIAAVDTTTDYFNVYVNEPLTRYWLEDHNAQLARAVNDIAADHPPQSIWLQDRLANDNPSLEFLAGGKWMTVRNESPPARVDGLSLRQAQGKLSVVLFVDPNHDWSALRSALPPSSTLTLREGPLAQGDRDAQPRRAFIGLQAVGHAAQRNADETRQSLRATFEAGIRLHRAEVAQAPAAASGGSSSTPYVMTLEWSATQPISEDYAVFVHWVRNGELLTQSDNSPAQGYLPMPRWRAGDTLVDEHTLIVPGGTQPGDEVRIGIYRRGESAVAPSRRLNVLDERGRPVADSVIISPPQ